MRTVGATRTVFVSSPQSCFPWPGQSRAGRAAGPRARAATIYSNVFS
jgi:hypothetical protein